MLLNFELLENILLHTTSFEILAAVEVCRHWHDVVENSRPLRRRLSECQSLLSIPTQTHPLVGLTVMTLNSPGQRLWHFKIKATEGTIFIFRYDHDEAFIWVPDSPNSYLVVLDGRYRRVATSSKLERVPNFEWYAADGSIMTRTKCKRARHFGNILRSYLLAYHGRELVMAGPYRQQAAEAAIT